MILDWTTLTGPCFVMYLGFAASFSLQPVWISKAGRLCALVHYVSIPTSYDAQILSIFFRWSNRGKAPLPAFMSDSLYLNGYLK